MYVWIKEFEKYLLILLHNNKSYTLKKEEKNVASWIKVILGSHNFNLNIYLRLIGHKWLNIDN